MRHKFSRMGKCKLCGSRATLQESHVIPRFIRKSMRGTGAVEDPKYYVGEGARFHKLEQDMPKKFWLCRACEQLLSNSEKSFAELVYQGLWQEGKRAGKARDEHVHKFLVSMVWRAWHWFDEHSANTFSEVSNLDRLREAEEVWRNYLLGNRGNVGQFQQHMLVHTMPVAYPSRRAVDLNGYYWSRGIGLDVLGTDGTIHMLHTKIPKIAIFGIVEPRESGRWGGTLVEPRLGDTWSGQKAMVPDAAIRYMSGQRDKMRVVLYDVPERVRMKTGLRMDQLIETECDDYLKRDAVRAMVMDDMVEWPEESIVTEAMSWLGDQSDAQARRVGEILASLSYAEMRSLHRETNRIGLRCKTFDVEERIDLSADGCDSSAGLGTAIIVSVEVFRTRKRAEEQSSLPLIFEVEVGAVTLALDAKIVRIPKDWSKRGVLRTSPISPLVV